MVLVTEQFKNYSMTWYIRYFYSRKYIVISMFLTRANLSVLGKQVVLVNEQIGEKKRLIGSRPYIPFFMASLYSGIFSLSLSSLNQKKKSIYSLLFVVAFSVNLIIHYFLFFYFNFI